MKLKGEMTIELEDQNTGEVQTIHEKNMVTNAINDLLGLNPCGAWFNGTGNTIGMQKWNDFLLPICPNMVGGIMLFSKVLTENVDNIFPSSDNLPIAYGSNDVNSGTDLARGSLNQSESKAIENGYKFVWEFTPSQGNGTIAAVGLTSKQGGANVYGSEAGSATALQIINENNISDIGDALIPALFRTVEIGFADNLLYSIAYASNKVTVTKYRYPCTSIGLNEKLDGTSLTLLETHELSCRTFKFNGGSYSPGGGFFDGKDGYWYGFANAGNSSGSASVAWIKISKTDYTFTEGNWTLSNAKLLKIATNFTGVNPSLVNNAVMRNGYLYVLANDKTGIYKINANNSADVTLISFGFTSAYRAIDGNYSNYLILVNDVILGYDFMIDINDTVHAIKGENRLSGIMTAVFQYNQYLVFFGSTSSKKYMKIALVMPYLATINNLSSTVTKNADKMMRITYTLTEGA